MAISRKPRASKEGVNVDELINKGGSVPRETSGASKTVTVPLRFSNKELLERIDKAVSAHSVKISRNTWLHYAITEKLERDGF